MSNNRNTKEEQEPSDQGEDKKTDGDDSAPLELA